MTQQINFRYADEEDVHDIVSLLNNTDIRCLNSLELPVTVNQVSTQQPHSNIRSVVCMCHGFIMTNAYNSNDYST